MKPPITPTWLDACADARNLANDSGEPYAVESTVFDAFFVGPLRYAIADQVSHVAWPA